MAIKFIDDYKNVFDGKRVIARFDFNVPLDKDDPTKILDTARIDMALESIKFLLDAGVSKLTLMSHLGRPKGKVNSSMSLAPVAEYLSAKLEADVILTEKAVDAGVKELLGLKSTKIVLLENLRFHKEETAGDEFFAQNLASYGDVYVNDAFGAAHRKHASVYGINKFFKNDNYAGLLVKRELIALDKILNRPSKPFVGIVGGAKVSDKIKTIEKLLVSVDHLLIGGAMAYPFLKSKGVDVGTSLCSDEDIKLAESILKADKFNKIVLPVDHVIAAEFGGTPLSCEDENIPSDHMGLDIGENTQKKYAQLINTSKTILWNGPMGLFENVDFAKGTFAVASACAKSTSFSVVGGGDSVSAIKKSGLSDQFSHISSGGGASLEYIEKGELPGINALKFGVN